MIFDAAIGFIFGSKFKGFHFDLPISVIDIINAGHHVVIAEKTHGQVGTGLHRGNRIEYQIIDGQIVSIKAYIGLSNYITRCGICRELKRRGIAYKVIIDNQSGVIILYGNANVISIGMGLMTTWAGDRYKQEHRIDVNKWEWKQVDKCVSIREGAIGLVRHVKPAQQVDSAEASTIAVPPSEPPSSPR